MDYFIKLCLLLILVIPRIGITVDELSLGVGGGSVIPRKNMPVAQFFMGSPSVDYAISGILIAPTKVLTMANKYNIGIRRPIASSIVYIGGKRHRVKSVAFHPLYEMSEEKCDQLEDVRSCFFYSKYDLAVLTLTKKSKVKPWPILSKRKLRREDSVYFYGFGEDISGNHGALKRGYSKIKKVQTDNLTVRTKLGGDRVCGGDQGGPVMLINRKKRQLGIIGIIDGWKTYNCDRKNIIHMIPLQEKATIDFIQKEAPKARMK